MSFKARRLAESVEVAQFDWSQPMAAARPAGVQPMLMPIQPAHAPAHAPASAPAPAAAHEPSAADVAKAAAAIEHEAFVKGYAQGERAGLEAASTRGQAMMRRLGETVQELTALRAEMLQRTERQVVQLAMAIAEKMIHREISLDRSILVGMARAALDRLSEQGAATIRLHPDDFAAVKPADGSWESSHVQVVADPLVARGGCLVQSDFGFMDVDVASQFRELTRVLLDQSSQGSSA